MLIEVVVVVSKVGQSRKALAIIFIILVVQHPEIKVPYYIYSVKPFLLYATTKFEWT